MMRVSVDGVPLDDAGKRWFVDYATLLPGAAPRSVAKLKLPGRAGPIVARQGWGEGALRLVLDVPPVGAFGGMPTGPVEERVATLQALLSRAESVSVSVDGGASRVAAVTDVQVSDPARLGVNAWQLQATLTLQPFWSEGAAILSAAKSPPGALVFTEWAGSTGDVVDGIMRVKGPLTELSVIGSDGTGASLKTAVSSTQYLFINVATFQAWLSTSATAWTPTTSRVLLDYPAAGPLRLTPEDDGAHLTVTGAGFGTGTEVRLRGKRWWL